MPLTPINYANGMIYKIQHNINPEMLYVGSTCNFRQRKSQHKFKCNEGGSVLYKKMREHGEWSDYSMVLIKCYPCASSLELRAEEDRHIRELKATLNGKGAVLDVKKHANSAKEYRAKHREAILKYFKGYYLENKDAILHKQKQAYECPCGKSPTYRNRSRHLRTAFHIKHVPSTT
tara:strand:- start:521 stop:1048 length:528 start_codon:yes stop_codon:yes gene_type:complete